MVTARPQADTSPGSQAAARSHELVHAIRRSARRILVRSHRELPLAEYLEEVSNLFAEQIPCEEVGIWLEMGGRLFRARARIEPLRFTYERMALSDESEPTLAAFRRLQRDRSTAPGVLLFALSPTGRPAGFVEIRLATGAEPTPDQLLLCDNLAELLGVAVSHRSTRVALRERLKELTCLLQINQAVAEHEVDLDDALQRIVRFIPPAWQYPEHTAGRIVLGDREYLSDGFREGPACLRARLSLDGQDAGTIEVFYTVPKPELDEGPFLNEERNLVDAIARKVELLLERKQTEREREAFRLQLMHADRLATIGQLAAGVAHELNEPLGHILGFAQLARKLQGLAGPTAADLDRIIHISLDARKVIRRLMLFARQVPARKEPTDLNLLVREGSRLFGARCAKNGIELRFDLSEELTRIVVDSSQLNQVLINLVVNAMHAMPDGGRLTIATRPDEHGVLLAVTDTGVGMSDEVLRKVFLPFFTTKDVDQGTGLGLAVVHGIVRSHGGRIDIHSQEGQGARFEVRLPISGDGAPARSSQERR